jgi:3-hydroxyisobutyrate dehydrogenase-like beta-hydroxyacid dehydrogenase
MTSSVTVIGLGLMGFALARTLLQHGHRVTVWNRTLEKGRALVSEGAVLAESVLDAVTANHVIIICVHDSTVTRNILESSEQVTRALSGRVLVELSTRTPLDAKEAQSWAEKYGADYLAGAILAVPSQIGQVGSTILVSGSESAYKLSESFLQHLVQHVSYVGPSVGAAATLDLAFLSYLFAAMIGFVHAARLCQVEGVPVAALNAMLAAAIPATGKMITDQGQAIDSGDYSKPESTLEICAQAIQLLLQQARDTHIDASFPLFATDLFKRALDAGLGEEKVGALIKVLRNTQQ